MNILRQAVAEEIPQPTGMGSLGWSEYTCPVVLDGGGLHCRIMSDPLIAVGRGNEIARRSVAKPKREGTIKENWAVGDWNVNISGIIIAKTVEEMQAAVRELSAICAVRESVEITCPPLNDIHDITRIAIADLQLPFTPGELNQQFTITAYSDTSYELLEEL